MKIRHTTPNKRKEIINSFCETIDKVYLIDKLAPIQGLKEIQKLIFQSEKYNFLNTSDISLLNGYLSAIQKYSNKINNK